MNWNANDLDIYFQQKEYIDTLLVPLLKINTMQEQLKSSASSTEFLMHLSHFIEKQFKGRMMMMPPFTYTQSTRLDEMAATIKQDLQQLSFRHIFYITTDRNWTNEKMYGEVMWLPSIPLESMDQKLRQTVLEDQFRQILPIMTEKWTSIK